MTLRCRLSAISAMVLIPGAVIGSGNIHTTGSFISDAPGGTPPLVVNSSDLVPNLNADMLDGTHGMDFALKTEVPDDGVLEINQDCAVNTGCFTGDSAGFPVSITFDTLEVGSSFRLTSNLDVSGLSTPEEVTAISVTNIIGPVIDLNGFSIIGPNTCTGFDGPSLSCTHQSSMANTGNGIRGGQAVTVMNGTIRGMGGIGFFCNVNCRILNMTFAFNGRSGADLFGNSLVHRSVFFRNAADGLETGISSNVALVSADGNAGVGIEVANASAIQHSTAQLNGGSGIVALNNSIVSHSTSRNNAGHGIDITDSLAMANTIVSNSGNGLNMSTDAVARSNAIWSDTMAGGNQMGDNWCGTGLCP